MSKEFSVTGYEELLSSLDEMAKEYPDVTYNAMVGVGNTFKRTLRKNVKEAMKTYERPFSADDYKRMMKGFRTTVRGYGNTTLVEFSGQGRGNADWHLIEDGHEMVASKTHTVATGGCFKTVPADGKEKGSNYRFIRGIKQVPATVEGFGDEYEKAIDRAMKRMIDKYER